MATPGSLLGHSMGAVGSLVPKGVSQVHHTPHLKASQKRTTPRTFRGIILDGEWLESIKAPPKTARKGVLRG